MRYSKIKLLLFILFVFIIYAIPKQMNYQGRLLDSFGIGINDTLDVTFRLFTSQTGGEALWEEVVSDVIIDKGLFSVELGGINAFPESVDFTSQYFLEIEIGGEILSPREKLTSAPYSIRAGSVESAVQSVNRRGSPITRTGTLVLAESSGATISEEGDSIFVFFGITGVETAPNFTLNISQASLSVYRGSDITNRITIVQLTPGISPLVTLTALGLPDGASASFSPTTCSPNCNSTLTITTTEDTPPGTYTIMITGESDEVIRTATFTLEVNIPFDYTLAVDPSSSTIDQGSNTSTIVTASLLTGFPEEVSYSISGLPSGALATFSPTSCILSCSATLGITTSITTPPGTYDCEITAMTTSGVVRTITFSLIVEYFDFNLSASPTSISLDQGASTSSSITATRISEVTQTLNFSITPSPMYDDISVDLTSTSCSPTCNTTLNISTTSLTTPGNYPIYIIANAVGGSVDTLTIDLTVEPFDFTLALNPSEGGIAPTGGPITSTISATLISPETQTVTFTHSSPPDNVSIDITPSSCDPTCTTTLTINSSGASAGSYTIDITGTSISGVERTETYTLMVCSASSAPQNLTADSGSDHITLNWQAPSSDGGCSITNYNIYRGTSSNPTDLLTTVGNVLTYTDNSVSSGTTYYYRITAINSSGESPYSNEVSGSAVLYANCKAILDGGGSSGNGFYYVQPSPPSGPIVEVYCDMSSGGHTIASRVQNWGEWGSNFTVVMRDRLTNSTGNMTDWDNTCSIYGLSRYNGSYGAGGNCYSNTSTSVWGDANSFYNNLMQVVFPGANYNNILILHCDHSSDCWAHYYESGSLSSFGSPSGSGYAFCRSGNSASKRYHIYLCD